MVAAVRFFNKTQEEMSLSWDFQQKVAIQNSSVMSLDWFEANSGIELQTSLRQLRVRVTNSDTALQK